MTTNVRSIKPNSKTSHGDLECFDGCQKRCRHGDCLEGHPVGRAGEKITCETCRAYLGLPLETPFEHVCPDCRATQKFTITRTVDFKLGERAPTIAVRGDDVASCGVCDWTGHVRDLQSHSERTILCSFSVSMNYDIPIKVRVPKACETDEQLAALIKEGEIDWLEEINWQYSTVAIEKHAQVEHRELLSVEFTTAEADGDIE
jgi:hypothetical protein